MDPAIPSGRSRARSTSSSTSPSAATGADRWASTTPSSRSKWKSITCACTSSDSWRKRQHLEDHLADDLLHRAVAAETEHGTLEAEVSGSDGVRVTVNDHGGRLEHATRAPSASHP